MILPSFLSIFKKKQKSLKFPKDSLLIKALKKVCENNNLTFYENITIYHHTKNIFIPFMIFDETKGIYLFEYKEWSYDDLKNSTISKSKQNSSSSKNLAYEKTHNFIKQKFNEIIHNDGAVIHNFLLMENLNNSEYNYLNDSFKELLPQQKIIFAASTEVNILKKLKNIDKNNTIIYDKNKIMGNLLIQYSIFSKQDFKTSNIYLASKEQIKFIKTPLIGLQTLAGDSYSGKTSSIILKVILEKLKNSEFKILIIKPTKLSCDILKKKMLDIIEHGIIEVDISSIEITTPLELINKHLLKIKKPSINTFQIDNILMQKEFLIADLIICDDSNIMTLEFKEYLKYIQKNLSLLLVDTNSSYNPTHKFTKNFRNKKLEINFYKANEYAKTLHTISNLLKKNKSNEILVVCNDTNKIKLPMDLKSFIKDEIILVDGNLNLEYQRLDSLLICSYSEISSINTKFVILLNTKDTSTSKVEYALNLASEKAFVIYEEENENIKKIKEKNV